MEVLPATTPLLHNSNKNYTSPKKHTLLYKQLISKAQPSMPVSSHSTLLAAAPLRTG